MIVIELIQVATYVTGSLAAPGRTLITMAIDAYTNSASTLKQVAEFRECTHGGVICLIFLTNQHTPISLLTNDVRADESDRV